MSGELGCWGRLRTGNDMVNSFSFLKNQVSNFVEEKEIRQIAEQILTKKE